MKAVLFDLDGTLLPLDYELFFTEYMKLIGRHVAHLVDPEVFTRQLWASTAVMVRDTSAMTNETVFANDFFPKIGLPQDVMLPVIQDFYENKFSHLSYVAKASAAARQAVQAVLARGKMAVVATNPIFPRVAIEARLQWANVRDLSFSHVTCYEDSCFCKPNPSYYLEVAEKIGCDPADCLMVGNDVEEDLIAATVGMKTYLVTDCLINAKQLTPKTDYTGTLEELAAFLHKR